MEYIAEVGSNWRTSKDYKKCWIELKEFITELAHTGVHYVKFQAWNTPKFIHPEHPDYNQFVKYELPSDWYGQIIKLCEELKVELMMSVFDADTANELHDLGLAHWKIASGEVTNLELIEHIARFNQPMYLSTGNANSYEIRRAVDTIRAFNVCPLTIFHCISKYPTKLNEIGLNHILELNDTYEYCDIGWSNHVAPDQATIAGAAAVACGVDVIETHVRPDNVDSPDSAFAMTTSELIAYMRTLESIDFDDPVVDEHELLWSRRGDDGLRPWINWEVRTTEELKDQTIGGWPIPQKLKVISEHKLVIRGNSDEQTTIEV